MHAILRFSCRWAVLGALILSKARGFSFLYSTCLSILEDRLILALHVFFNKIYSRTSFVLHLLVLLLGSATTLLRSCFRHE